MSKSDPSYKSKKYRDKLRQEIRELEHILPVERATLHRRLDSQTIFRLAIAYFRTKLFLKADKIDGEDHEYRPIYGCNVSRGIPTHVGIRDNAQAYQTDAQNKSNENKSNYARNFINSDHLLQALDGFLLILTTDGTMMYVSSNILQHLGFNQVDIMMRCIYGIIHPDDQEEVKATLERGAHTLDYSNNQGIAIKDEDYHEFGRKVSFLCRMKSFSGANTGYLKMQCVGQMRSFPHMMKSQRTTNHVLFAFCRPFVAVNTGPEQCQKAGFWTKHDLDLRFKEMDKNIEAMLGYTEKELQKQTMYQLMHPEDLHCFRACHRTLMHTDEIQTLYFRLQHKQGTWMWLHTRGKLVLKNSKKYSIVFTHCPVNEEDSTFIQQEVLSRRRSALHSLMYGDQGQSMQTDLSHNSHYHGVSPMNTGESAPPCPSSWHTTADRHSPVFPNNNHTQISQYKKQARMCTTDIKLRDQHSQHMAHSSYQHENNNQFHQIQSHEQIICPIPQKTKRYHFRFDGIGIPNQIPTQNYGFHYPSEYSHMFIQGHVTATETPNYAANFDWTQGVPYPYQNPSTIPSNIPLAPDSRLYGHFNNANRYSQDGYSQNSIQQCYDSRNNTQSLCKDLHETTSNMDDIPSYVDIKKEENSFCYGDKPKFRSCRYAEDNNI